MVLPMSIQKDSREQDEVLEEIYQHRLQSMPEISTKIAHQWKQPLAVLSLMISGLTLEGEERINSHEKLEDFRKRALKQIDFMFDTVNAFSNYCNMKKDQSYFSIEKTVESAKNICTFFLKLDGIKVHTNIRARTHIYGNQTELIQVMVILLSNARDAIVSNRTKGGIIFIDIDQFTGGYRVKIIDNGEGIPDELLPEEIFKRGVSTKKEQGDGMGLSIAKEIIETHFDGGIHARNIKSGAEFTLILPVGKTPYR